MKNLKNKSLFLSIFLLFSWILGPPFINGQSADSVTELYKKLEWRNIGPAVMGGRTVDIDVVEKTPWIIYAAIGPSGVWKSKNNGYNWEPIFDNENSVSVGDVTVSQSQPHIVWVGTGEHTCRNSVTIGDGVYKSEDSGKTWHNMGLKNTRHISRIIINPGDPNIVFVGAMGHLWGPNKERGVFKTVDGGKTWEKVLYINETTGIADLAVDPSNSLILYASAYEFGRSPHYFYSGGENSGLYRSVDGGTTWNKLTKDLPEGILGRIGIAVSRSKPNVVYALIEHKDGGIWRSEDRGESWKRTCDYKTYKKVNFRPFYYSQIRVDPSDDKRIFVFSGGSFVSNDMGKKFRSISGKTHSDHHDLWIDPKNPLHLIDGNDGGIDITYDGGKNWFGVQNIILSEVYQIGFDLRDPYFVYCGLQDNGIWGGPSSTYDTKGISNRDWYSVGGGDGFYCQVDPDDPMTIYGNSQINGLYRYDHRTGLSKNIRPLASLKQPPFRYNWNAPIHISPHDSKILYTAGNYLFKTTNRGIKWDIISPDLTTNNPEKMKDSGGPITLDNSGAESHCTIIAIAESPLEEGVIWCGTDDGNVQITKDGGQNWTNVVDNIAGLPSATWCSHIEPSRFEKGTAYASFDGHRNDDYNTYLFKTKNYGKTWKAIHNNLPFGWIHVIREDLKNKNLLYAGMEFGIYASLDSGQSWFSLGERLPTVAVRDLAVHPIKNDLIIGTHGRGIWILDDISFLQEMTPEVLRADQYLFSIRPVTQYFESTQYENFSVLEGKASNPIYGVRFITYFKDIPADIPKIFIKNNKGEQIFEIRLKKRKGFQKAFWNLTTIPKTKDGKTVKPSSVFLGGPFVRSGTYQVEMKVGDSIIEKSLIVKSDPRIQISEENRVEQSDFMVRSMILQKKMGLSITGVNKLGRNIKKIKKKMKEAENINTETITAFEKFENKFKIIEKNIKPSDFSRLDSREFTLRGGNITSMLMILGLSVRGFPFKVTETDNNLFKELSQIVEKKVAIWNDFIKMEIPLINKILKEASLKTVSIPKKVDL